MNDTLITLRVPALLAFKTPLRLGPKGNNLRFSDNVLLFIEKIHARAETVTPVLKEIPGYPHRHGDN
jgi:hypothetical protein